MLIDTVDGKEVASRSDLGCLVLQPDLVCPIAALGRGCSPEQQGAGNAAFISDTVAAQSSHPFK